MVALVSVADHDEAQVDERRGGRGRAAPIAMSGSGNDTCSGGNQDRAAAVPRTHPRSAHPPARDPHTETNRSNHPSQPTFPRWVGFPSVAATDVYPDDDELDLRVYIDLLRRRWLVIAITLALVVVAALAFTFQATPMYRATSDILIEQTTNSVIIQGQQTNVQQAERGLNNEERVFESPKVKAAVEEVYDGPLNVGRVKASTSSGQSDVLSTSVTAADPDDAVELLDIYVETFIEVRRTDRLEQILAISNQIESQISALNEQIDEIRAPLTEVENQLAADPENESLQAQQEELEASLSGQLEPLLRQRANFQAQVEELGVTQDILELGNVTVLGNAEASNSPVSPKPARNLAVAVVVGLILGVGLAFARDALDNRIRGTSDVEELTGRPTLAIVPAHDKAKVPTFVSTRDDAQGVHAEAYRALRTAIRFAGIDDPIKVIQVTSPNQGEGKTTTAANLAVAFAQAGQRVLLVCCDLRRPTVHERFHAAREPGFTDVLVGDVQPADVLNRTVDPPVAVLTAGAPTPNPSELLSTDRAEAVIRTAGERFDIVVLDSPPVLPVTDAVIVSNLVDAVVLVADARSTTRDRLASAVRTLDQAQAPLLGVVLNGVRKQIDGVDYGYGYGYAEAPPKQRRGRRAANADVAAAEAEAESPKADLWDQADSTIEA